MQNSRNLLSCLAITIMALLVASCSSDPNPVDYLNFDKQSSSAKTLIQLTLNPSETRAPSTDDAISKVNLYIFDADNNLEDSKLNLNYDSDKSVIELNVTEGTKTIYAITADNLFDFPKGETASLSAFESKVFEVSIAKLKKDKEFVMVGKTQANVESSSSHVNIPEANKIKIKLDRLLAKIKIVAEDNSLFQNLGFAELRNVSFKVCQANTKMSILPLKMNEDLLGSASNGIYSAYSNLDYSYVASSIGTSTGEWQYVTENFVEHPTSGNTTFVSIRMQVTPNVLYYNSYGSFGKTQFGSLTGDPNDRITSGMTFYTLGVCDENGNLLEICTDDLGKIICLRDEDAVNLLIGNGEIPNYVSINVLPNGYMYKPVQFTDGYCYYRLNISDELDGSKKYRVLRNTSYKININNVEKFGFPSEASLIPESADSEIDNSSLSVIWSTSSFTVNPWNEVNDDNANL